MSNYLQEFGTYVKESRMKIGFYSQRSFAEKIGVSNSTIAKIERGAHEASDETLHKFAEIFNVNYMELLEKQASGTKADGMRLEEKIKKLNKTQIDIVTSMVNEFLRLGGK